MSEYISLNMLSPYSSATVFDVGGEDGIKQRFEDLGIIPGSRIGCIMKSPLGDPTAYLCCGAVIAIRREDAENIRLLCNSVGTLEE